MRIFVDIGSHVGQTLEEVVRSRWAFDEIHAIEPMPRELEVLHERFGADPRVVIHPFALADFTGTLDMFGTNDHLEASIYREKNDVDGSVVTTVHCVDATALFDGLTDAELFVNLNCEGAEIPILDSLVNSRELLRVASLLVSFDISKVPGMESEELRVRERMAAIGFERYTSHYADKVTHQEQIASWLEQIGP